MPNDAKKCKVLYLHVVPKAGRMTLDAPAHLVERANAGQHARFRQHIAQLVQVDDGRVGLDGHSAVRVRPCKRLMS